MVSSLQWISSLLALWYSPHWTCGMVERNLNSTRERKFSISVRISFRVLLKTDDGGIYYSLEKNDPRRTLGGSISAGMNLEPLQIEGCNQLSIFQLHTTSAAEGIYFTALIGRSSLIQFPCPIRILFGWLVDLDFESYLPSMAVLARRTWFYGAQYGIELGFFQIMAVMGDQILSSPSLVWSRCLLECANRGPAGPVLL